MSSMLSIFTLQLLQVFPNEGFDELFQQHAKKVHEGTAPFYKQTLKVCSKPCAGSLGFRV